MPHSFTKTIYRLLQKWEQAYKDEVRSTDYPYFQGVYIEPYLFFSEEDEKKEEIKKAEKLLKKQIEFIQRLVAYMMLSGESEENLEHINRFLSNQHIFDSKYIGAEKPEFQIWLCGGCSGISLVVNVENFNQLDFADSWAEERYAIIKIMNYKWKKWTKRRIDNTLEHIKNDFEFDGFDVKVTLDSGKIGQPAEKPIWIYCKIQE